VVALLCLRYGKPDLEATVVIDFGGVEVALLSVPCLDLVPVDHDLIA